ncbi:MAG: KEOPS complex kinase/ATPase Bud32 [Nitrosopumilaceae archaeon]|jgi:TP53 regulating kinase-like protein
MELVKKGAEADIYNSVWNNSKIIMKIRKPKNYRNPTLDRNLRKQRTIRESQTLMEVKSFGIPTPLVYFVNLKDSSIIMQRIPGKPIHDLPNSKIISLSEQMGSHVGLLHKNGIMHGDLTTSNFILFQDKVYVIDFGLSQKTIKLENHAVDLRLIKEILNSAHASIMKESWKNFLSGYRNVVGHTKYSKIIKLVSEIESRGRYATVI